MRRENKRNNKRNKLPQQFKKRKRRPCFFCLEKKEPDYKDLNQLRRFLNDRGKIVSPRSSGCCPLHQRRVARAIKHTRTLGLLPYLMD